MKKKLVSHAIQLTIFGTTLAIPQFALAEQARLEEVVVVARRRSEDLQQVPIAVTAFTSSDIQSAGINRPQDFISLTPNVSIVDAANAGDTQVTIRGQYSTRDAESTFAYVVDGVLITNPNGFNGELFDVEQIEVLKGPAASLYGRGDPGGTVNIVTKKPQPEAFTTLQTSAGSWDRYRTSLDSNTPLRDDGSLLSRINLAVEDNGSFRDHVDNRRQIVTPSLTWQLDPDTTLQQDCFCTSAPQDLYVNSSGSICDSRLRGEDIDPEDCSQITYPIFERFGFFRTLRLPFD